MILRYDWDSVILFTLFLFIYLYSLVEVTKIKGKGGILI